MQSSSSAILRSSGLHELPNPAAASSGENTFGQLQKCGRDSPKTWVRAREPRQDRVAKVLETIREQQNGTMWIKLKRPEIPTPDDVSTASVAWMNSRQVPNHCFNDRPKNFVSFPYLETCKGIFKKFGQRATSPTDDKGEYHDGVCCVCMERATDTVLLPCNHNSFCRQCVVESICVMVQTVAPRCPLCRTKFDTMLFFD
mmetsp:Transcript_659/g.1494  ORF Transcript_659/g.1494 Transcript_659/m.1494 type:complete len:200 (+) Transcript_659:44-643(+)